MSSSGADSNRLIATALGAAVAGATIAIGAVKWMETTSSNNNKDKQLSERDASSTMEGRPIRRSFIYEDSTTDPLGRGDSSSALLFPHNHEEKMRRRVVARAAVEEDNMTPRRLVTVRVPATSANVGPGCKFFFLF